VRALKCSLLVTWGESSLLVTWGESSLLVTWGESSPRALVAGSIRFSDLGVILGAAGWESLASHAAEILSRSGPESGQL
jgi:hypothetical protein